METDFMRNTTKTACCCSLTAELEHSALKSAIRKWINQTLDLETCNRDGIKFSFTLFFYINGSGRSDAKAAVQSKH